MTPGYTHKEDFAHGAAAANAGGFGVIVCMPNTAPVIDTPDLVRSQYERSGAVQGDRLRILHAAAVTLGQKGQTLTDFAALKAAGAAALSDDGQPILDARVMFDALQAARDVGLPIMTHSEDYRLRDGGGAVAENYMVARDLEMVRHLELADTAKSPLHIQHVTTARAVDLIRQAKRDGIAVSCETCPHYFTFTRDLRETHGALAKVFPPLRTEDDRAAVLSGVLDGTIDIIASDHAPHTPQEKAQPWQDAPGGIVGMETSFAAAMSALPLNIVIDKMCYAPARLLGIDIQSLPTITIEPDTAWTVTADTFRTKTATSPWLGRSMKGKVSCSS